ncbi:MAG: hypothetical protein ACUVUC_16740, partial [Thermoguttaceae bacterium]
RQHGQSRVASKLWKYAFQTLPIILRAVRDTRPLRFFGLLALAFLSLGIALGRFVSVLWCVTGRTSAWTLLITLGAANVVVGILIPVMALIADQIGTLKRIQDEILFSQRRHHYSIG